MTPRTGEYVLNHLLREVAVAERVAGKAEQLARVTAIQLPQLVTAVVLWQSLHERCVARSHVFTLYAARPRAVRGAYLSCRAVGDHRRVLPVVLRRGRPVLLEPGVGTAGAASARAAVLHRLPDPARAGQLQHPARRLPERTH